MATGASTQPRRFQFRIWDLLYVTTLVAVFLAIRRIEPELGPYISYGVLGAELVAIVGLTAAFAARSPGQRLLRMAIRGVLAGSFLSPLCLWLPVVFVLGPMLDPAVVLAVAVAVGPLLGLCVGAATWWLHQRNPLHRKRAVVVAGRCRRRDRS
jgi:hypothetical protein